MTTTQLGHPAPRPTSPRSFGPQTRPPGVITRAKQTQFAQSENQSKTIIYSELRHDRPSAGSKKTNPIKANRPIDRFVPPAGPASPLARSLPARYYRFGPAGGPAGSLSLVNATPEVPRI